MVKHCLITRPHHDPETSYLHSFSKAIVALMKEADTIHLTDLEGAKANRERFEACLIKKQGPRLIFLNGHGDQKVVQGHDDQPILDEKNVRLVKGRIVYALACESLAELGGMAVACGADAYVGYGKKYSIVVDPSRTSAPDKDRNAAPFRRASHVLISSLIDGMPVGKAVERTKGEYRKLIRSYGTSEDNYGDAPLIGLQLAWNMIHLGMKGDAEAAF